MNRQNYLLAAEKAAGTLEVSKGRLVAGRKIPKAF